MASKNSRKKKNRTRPKSFEEAGVTPDQEEYRCKLREQYREKIISEIRSFERQNSRRPYGVVLTEISKGNCLISVLGDRQEAFSLFANSGIGGLVDAIRVKKQSRDYVQLFVINENGWMNNSIRLEEHKESGRYGFSVVSN